ncbi:MAG: hypothetical protein ACI9KK_000667 [Ascidiaceihabitans sp.]|jgi:hypothetical protein
MAQKRSKKHHYVSRAMQRPFCHSREKIWYSTRNEAGIFGDPEDRNIESTFKAKDYYTVNDGDNLSDIVERDYFGPLDDLWGDFRQQVLDVLSRGKIPNFSKESADILKNTVISFARRSPDFMNYDDYETGMEIINNTILALEESDDKFDEIPALQKQILLQSEVIKVGRDVRVRAQIDHSEKVEEAMQDFKIRWAKTDGKHSFILSSRMVYRIGNGGHNGISNPNAEIWMPIAPSYCLILLRDPQKEVQEINEIDVTFLRKINNYIVRESNQVGSHSEKLLRSLTNRRSAVR